MTMYIKKYSPTILGIETSYDDISLSITQNKFVLLYINIKQKIYDISNGIIPENATKEHMYLFIKYILPYIYNFKKKLFNNISAISYTQGPGLSGPLLIGETIAKTISLILNKPIITVNHLIAHLFVNFLYGMHVNNIIFPFIGLIISGGNTKLIFVKNYYIINIIGKTLDISLGNLYDNVSKFMKLSLPGSIIIEKYAKYGKNNIKFTVPKTNNLNFSFSGLETQILNYIKNNKNYNIYNLCNSFQNIIFKILMNKIKLAINIFNVKSIVISGGVISNINLKNKFISFFKKSKYNLYIPYNNLSTDNAIMISITGEIKYKLNLFSTFNTSIYTKNFNNYIYL